MSSLLSMPDPILGEHSRLTCQKSNHALVVGAVQSCDVASVLALMSPQWTLTMAVDPITCAHTITGHIYQLLEPADRCSFFHTCKTLHEAEDITQVMVLTSPMPVHMHASCRKSDKHNYAFFLPRKLQRVRALTLSCDHLENMAVNAADFITCFPASGKLQVLTMKVSPYLVAGKWQVTE